MSFESKSNNKLDVAERGGDDGASAAVQCTTQNCNFFGTKTTNFLCSQCFKKSLSASSTSSDSNNSESEVASGHMQSGNSMLNTSVKTIEQYQEKVKEGIIENTSKIEEGGDDVRNQRQKLQSGSECEKGNESKESGLSCSASFSILNERGGFDDSECALEGVEENEKEELRSQQISEVAGPISKKRLSVSFGESVFSGDEEKGDVAMAGKLWASEDDFIESAEFKEISRQSGNENEVRFEVTLNRNDEPKLSEEEKIVALSLDSLDAVSEVKEVRVQADKRRCLECNKFLGFTGINCRCGFVFCGLHRYPDKHNCDFDFEGNARKKLVKNRNDAAVASKISNGEGL